MTRTLPETHRAVGYQGWHQTETVTYYHGRATITGPTANGQGWTERSVSCDHRHTDLAAAEECGRRLGAREARKAERAAQAEFATRACARTSEPYRMGFDEPDKYIASCLPHQSTGTHLYDTPVGADADDWTCPWAGVSA